MEAIKTKNLSVHYNHFNVFKEINLDIEQGKITSIIGANGCGKSTLLKAIGRIIKISDGSVYLNGDELSDLDNNQIALRLSMLSQSPTAPDQISVYDLISYGRYPHNHNSFKLTKTDKEKIEWAMEVTTTKEFEHKVISELSGGQRQRVFLAMALAQDTNIILLDEPTTYLDMSHQFEVLSIVEKLNKEKNYTIIMVLHDINHAARFSDNIIAMKQGAIIKEGTVAQVITEEVLKEVFNIEATIIQDEELNKPICYKYKSIKETSDA